MKRRSTNCYIPSHQNINYKSLFVKSTVLCKQELLWPYHTIKTISPLTLHKQAQPIDPDLTAKMLGRGVAVSPVVTVEPRRRKFHKAITLSMPAPRAHSQGMINQYSGNAPTLRLLCSITGTYEGTLCVPLVLNLNLFRFDLTPLPYSTYIYHSVCISTIYYVPSHPYYLSLSIYL